MKPITKAELRSIAIEINALIGKYADGSAYRGLTVVATGLSIVSDIYAQPNADNPAGMFDDPQSLRDAIADIIKTQRILKMP